MERGERPGGGRRLLSGFDLEAAPHCRGTGSSCSWNAASAVSLSSTSSGHLGASGPWRWLSIRGCSCRCPETELTVTFAPFELDRLCRLPIRAREALRRRPRHRVGRDRTLDCRRVRHFAKHRRARRPIATPAALEVAAGVPVEGLTRATRVAARVERRRRATGTRGPAPAHAREPWGLVVSNPPYLAWHEWAGPRPRGPRPRPER